MNNFFPVLFSLLSCCSLNTDKASGEHFLLLVGSYSDGTTPGISVYDFNIQSGEFTFVNDVKQVVNPSYLAVSQDEKMVYSVNETREGAVSAFLFDKRKGSLTFVEQQPTEGASPCYININKGQDFIVTANYGGGNISVFPLGKAGSIRPISMNISNDVLDAAASNIHTVVFSPDEKQLWATDLGKDMIYSFNVIPDAKGDFLEAVPENGVSMEPGSGPRHLAFHPNGKYLYCINELSGKVAVFACDGVKINPIQQIDSDTTQTGRRKGSADIHLTSDGRFLYSSNRLRSDGIAIFSVNPETGQLTGIGYQPTGIHPRNFIITPNDKFLLSANRNSNNIQIFEIDSSTGLLSDTGKEINLGQPVCLKLVRR